MLSFKEAFQYFATSFWTKSKNTFLTIENGINGILLDPKYELVNSVTNNTSITLPSLDTFDEIYIEMTNGENTVVHQASVKKGSLLSDNSAITYREILLDGIHDTQTYVTYDIATNTITPSYCEGVVIDGTTNVTTTVYVKKYVVSETTTTLSSGIISYDDTKANLGADNLQGAIEKLDDKIDGIEQTAINTSYNNSTSGLSATNVQNAIDENASIGNQALAIAKGRNQSLAYNNYSEMVTALNSMSKDELKRGQNIYIGTVGVPDLWVYSVETSSVTYSYVNDETIVNSLGTNTTIQVGYYKLAQLETQKADLTNLDGTDISIDDTNLALGGTNVQDTLEALKNAIKDLQTSIDSKVGEWKYHGFVNGTNEMTLPSDYKELLVTCEPNSSSDGWVPTYSSFPILLGTIPRNTLSSTKKYIALTNFSTNGNYVQCCEVYVRHNINCITREAQFDLEKAEARSHILEGLLKALEDIDNIIALIKKSASSSDAKNKLMEKYKFTEPQAKAIVDKPLMVKLSPNAGKG